MTHEIPRSTLHTGEGVPAAEVADLTMARELADTVVPDWKQQIERSLQPVATHLQEQVSQRLQSELDRLRSILEQDREQVVGSVRDALSHQIALLLADLQQRRVPPPAKTRATIASRKSSDSATTTRSRGPGAQPAQPRAPKRAPFGQPPPGPKPPQRPPSLARKQPPSAPPGRAAPRQSASPRGE